VGRLIDIFGPRRLFLISTSLVGVAGVVGTLAPNLGVLIASRVLLGFDTCAGYPAAMAELGQALALGGEVLFVGGTAGVASDRPSHSWTNACGPRRCRICFNGRSAASAA
jgi:MFS family permease